MADVSNSYYALSLIKINSVEIVTSLLISEENHLSSKSKAIWQVTNVRVSSLFIENLYLAPVVFVYFFPMFSLI